MTLRIQETKGKQGKLQTHKQTGAQGCTREKRPHGKLGMQGTLGEKGTQGTQGELERYETQGALRKQRTLETLGTKSTQ